MPFDFDAVVDRRLPDAYKWNVGTGELPMWVADMDFCTAPCVREALQGRAGHGAFGYCDVPDSYRATVARWWGERHGLALEEGEIVFSTGVVATLSSAVRALTNVHENVVVQPPVYNVFWNSVVNNGRHVVEAPLAYDGTRYAMDWEALEQAFADPQTTLMILCNPHNPTGNVWTAGELARLGSLAVRHGVVVVSDEIHCELTRPGLTHTPFAAASDACRAISLTAASPSKAFNLAGIQSSYFFAADPRLRHRVERQLNTDECAEPNSFAIVSTEAAYAHGGEWLDALRAYVQANKDLLRDALASAGLGVRMVASDATYLAWLDCSKRTDDADELCEHLRRATGLVLSAGSQYGAAGRAFLRMNLGTRRELVEDGIRRLLAGLA